MSPLRGRTGAAARASFLNRGFFNQAVIEQAGKQAIKGAYFQPYSAI